MHGHEPTRMVQGKCNRGLRHPWRLALLLGTAFVLTIGCNPIQLAGWVFSPDPIEAPKCSLVIKGKEAKVVIIAAHAMLPSDYTLMRSDWELSQRLTQLLEERFKENQEQVKVVKPSQVKTYMNKNPKWRELPPQEIGKHFKADWVINLEINSISLFDKSSANFFYHGNADITVTVTDAHKPIGEGEVYALPYQVEYPKTNPLERSEMGVNQFRAKFIERIAKDLAQQFASHPPREKYDGGE